MGLKQRLAIALGVTALAAAIAIPTVASASELRPTHSIGLRDRGNGDERSRGDSNGNESNGEDGKVASTPGGQARLRGGGGNGISYHGGPVITGQQNAYIIWYGNWAQNKKDIITTFISNLGGSPYYNINTTYYNGNNVHVSNSLNYVKSVPDNYSQGKSNLSDSAIQSIVANAISSGNLPTDTNGVYFVLTSSDVTKSGFLTSYCGWHTAATIAGSNIKYSFVGDSGGVYACNGQPNLSLSPNGDPGADALVSVMAHEMEEAATDPNLNAWYDTRGYENADKCAWTFGSTSTGANGSIYNMTLGGKQFLIQRNWVNAGGGYCALSY